MASPMEASRQPPGADTAAACAHAAHAARAAHVPLLPRRHSLRAEAPQAWQGLVVGLQQAALVRRAEGLQPPVQKTLLVALVATHQPTPASALPAQALLPRGGPPQPLVPAGLVMPVSQAAPAAPAVERLLH